MKQHILEHWIKLAQEIQEGLEMEWKDNQIIQADVDILDATYHIKQVRNSLVNLNSLKQHYSDLNT